MQPELFGFSSSGRVRPFWEIREIRFTREESTGSTQQPGTPAPSPYLCKLVVKKEAYLLLETAGLHASRSLYINLCFGGFLRLCRLISPYLVKKNMSLHDHISILSLLQWISLEPVVPVVNLSWLQALLLGELLTFPHLSPTSTHFYTFVGWKGCWYLPLTWHSVCWVTTPVPFCLSACHLYIYKAVCEDPASRTIPY